MNQFRHRVPEPVQAASIPERFRCGRDMSQSTKRYISPLQCPEPCIGVDHFGGGIHIFGDHTNIAFSVGAIVNTGYIGMIHVERERIPVGNHGDSVRCTVAGMNGGRGLAQKGVG